MPYTYQDNYLKLYPSDVQQVNIWQEKARDIVAEYFKTSTNSLNYSVLHPIRIEEYDYLTKIAQKIINNFKQIIIVGMGASSLNPKMTTSLGYTRNNISIKYLDTTDQLYYTQVMENINLRDTCFLVISKSGNTIEVLSLIGAILHDFQKQQITKYSNNFCIITGNGDNPLRNIATKIGAIILDHDENIGGRFSTFTNVGILPGLIAGYDIKAFINGANSVINSLWQERENSLPVKAAISLLLFNKPLLINIGYLKIFSDYLNWYNQIVSESLGKNGRGFTPLKNLGPMAQHSMFQLYLDGPTDKVYSFIYAKNSTPKGDIIIGDIPILTSYNLTNKSLAQINYAQFIASATSLEETQPVRKIILEQLNEENLGMLVMHSILEIIILGHLMEVDPFNQPSVEKIKTTVLKLL
ncbi:Glucose-6-phosphate isomerase [Rickettsiales bacterium Ac37b]|nr:Glucose-6-phosphate isomerase [Rickettsiales bacterium Ac37b]